MDRRSSGSTTKPTRSGEAPDREHRAKVPTRRAATTTYAPRGHDLSAVRPGRRTASLDEVGVGREPGAQLEDLGPHGRDCASSLRACAGRGRSGRRSICISAGPMPAVVCAAVPSRRPEVTKGERGSSGMVLRFSVIPARSRTSWASLPVSSASKGRRSTRSRWLSVPPDTSRKPSAGEGLGQSGARWPPPGRRRRGTPAAPPRRRPPPWPR